jgi:hypothetical protein
LPSLCAATTGGIYRHTQTDGRVAFEIDSGATVYIRNFIKAGSSIEKLIAEDLQTHRQH